MSSEVFMEKRQLLADGFELRGSGGYRSRSLLGTRYSNLFLLFLRRQRQPEHRNHPLSRNIDLGFRGIRQVQSLAVLAAVDLGIRPPGLFRVAAGLLDHILRVEPAFQMAAAEFALFVFLVAGALTGLLDLDLMVGKLGRSLRARRSNFASRQRTYPRSRGARAAGFGPTSVIVLEGERRSFWKLPCAMTRKVDAILNRNPDDLLEG